MKSSLKSTDFQKMISPYFMVSDPLSRNEENPNCPLHRPTSAIQTFHINFVVLGPLPLFVNILVACDLFRSDRFSQLNF